MSKLPVLNLGADPHERGQVQGRALSGSVRSNVSTYLARFGLVGVSPADALGAAERWLEYIRKDNPGYAEEMAGIADGAGMSEVEVTLLNARYEITYEVYALEAAQARESGHLIEQEGCTLFGLMPERTENGSCMIGQNWDWLAGVSGHCFIKRVSRGDRPDQGPPSFVGFSEAGIVGCKIGINQAGIGLCIAGLVSDGDGRNGMRKPMHVRCAEVLDAWRFSDALLPIVHSDRTCSTNFLLGHGDGEIINVEATSNLCAYTFPQNGVITHSNNLAQERRVASQMERLSPSTLFRAERVRRHLAGKQEPVGIDDIRQIMSDHFSHPQSVCMHPDDRQPEERRYKTITSVALDLTNRVLFATNGAPCEGPYESYPVAGQ
ncbi:MAG: hypothetical protein KDJ80_01575 [Nitratireductor sp.]|nr:hypothetical protein [Nitratireductor sp.]